jgi:hypothetical protein
LGSFDGCSAPAICISGCIWHTWTSSYSCYSGHSIKKHALPDVSKHKLRIYLHVRLKPNISMTTDQCHGTLFTRQYPGVIKQGAGHRQVSLAQRADCTPSSMPRRLLDRSVNGHSVARHGRATRARHR